MNCHSAIASLVFSLVAMPWAALAAESEAQVAANPGQDYELSATFMQQETFATAVEAWSKYLGGTGYWSTARLGGGLMLHAYDEVDLEDKTQHVQNIDYVFGYSMDSRGQSPVRFRSVFLAGYATLDRHAKMSGVGRDPTSYGFFETRHGFNLVPPTHEASGSEGASLLELGAGFRWNFIGSRDEGLAVGNTRVREMQVYPYLAANMYL